MNNNIANVARYGLKGLALLTLTNSLSFCTVGMEKYVGRMSSEQAAFNNSLHAIPVLYDFGYSEGHKFFYNDPNFLATKTRITGYSDLFGRDK